MVDLNKRRRPTGTYFIKLVTAEVTRIQKHCWSSEVGSVEFKPGWEARLFIDTIIAEAKGTIPKNHFFSKRGFKIYFYGALLANDNLAESCHCKNYDIVRKSFIGLNTFKRKDVRCVHGVCSLGCAIPYMKKTRTAFCYADEHTLRKKNTRHPVMPRNFLVFFIPGFISLKVYSLLIPSSKVNFSKSIFEVVGFSAINFSALSWLIYLNYKYNFYNTLPILFLISIILVFFIMPILWPIIFVRIISSSLLSKHVINLIQKPWDYVFNKREAFWVIVNLKDGTKIGGIYDSKSFASSFPSKEQIYLEQVWNIDKDGKFLNPIERSKGIIILGDDISSLELFE